MSYILDALKKAEAERHIGQIPGLHVQPAAALPRGSAPAHSNKVLMVIAAVLVGVGVLLAWLQPWQSQATQSSQVAATQPEPAAPTGAPTAVSSTPSPSPQIVVVTPPPELPKPVERDAAKPRSPVTPRPRETAKSAPASTMAKPSAVQPPSPTVSGGATASDLRLSTALTPEAGVSSPGELPEQIQRELPALAIGGYIYSDNPRERQLLVNKRLLHEGAEAAPGVRLEKMLPNAAVFNYKGYRYRLSY
ncbi:general secretion pathway protein GspB [Janthinobacterium sp. 17J80-10]|uniref:general secretion pathway protein GspB n=1 Tax=Janthinobacterium sp. 17J80-10 TaxID=2497863 RepID=UPI001005A633|nr:general secretion pathway protein GspB [Janthinobacterium sp. 17J80-10]QAU35186.1 hypothetical protein EKL02_13930 [Janthinobacterium sp. 17J80-10]